MGFGVSDNPQVLEDLRTIFEEQEKSKDKAIASSRYSSVQRKNPDVIIKKVSYSVEKEPESIASQNKVSRRSSSYSTFNPNYNRIKSDANLVKE